MGLSSGTHTMDCLRDGLHVSAVLATDVVQRIRHLAQGGMLDTLHQGLETILATACHRLEAGELRATFISMDLVEVANGGDLRSLFLLARPRELYLGDLVLLTFLRRNVLTPMSGKLPSYFFCS